jgi:hypothetical protein
MFHRACRCVPFKVRDAVTLGELRRLICRCEGECEDAARMGGGYIGMSRACAQVELLWEVVECYD